jgi:hypothetical protein
MVVRVCVQWKVRWLFIRNETTGCFLNVSYDLFLKWSEWWWLGASRRSYGIRWYEEIMRELPLDTRWSGVDLRTPNWSMIWSVDVLDVGSHLIWNCVCMEWYRMCPTLTCWTLLRAGTCVEQRNTSVCLLSQLIRWSCEEYAWGNEWSVLVQSGLFGAWLCVCVCNGRLDDCLFETRLQDVS